VLGDVDLVSRAPARLPASALHPQQHRSGGKQRQEAGCDRDPKTTLSELIHRTATQAKRRGCSTAHRGCSPPFMTRGSELNLGDLKLIAARIVS
jgi:hypothetical protein